MSTKAEALRTAITTLTAMLAIEEGKPVKVPDFDTDAAEKQRLAEIAESMKPRPFQDLAPGHIIDVGDNDPPDDDLLRAFGPFIQAATDAGQLDSAGERFTLQTIKKRAGVGPASWGVVRDEVRAKWFSPWGAEWRAHQANAFKVPNAAVVDALFSKAYA